MLSFVFDNSVNVDVAVAGNLKRTVDSSEVEGEPSGIWTAIVFQTGLLFSAFTSGCELSNGIVEESLPSSPKMHIGATMHTKVVIKKKSLLLMTLLGLSVKLSAALTVDLEKFTSGAGVRFYGTSGANVGSSVSVIGDHNGDGFQDYIFGVRTRDLAVIVMKRNTTYIETVADQIVSDQYYRVIKGPTGSDLGATVGGTGDINADGFDDVVVGAPSGPFSGRTYSGNAFVIFGMEGPFTDVTVTVDWAASSIGFRILGAAAFSSFVAITRSARGLGDVNGDGINDFAVSACTYKGTSAKTSAGVVWVIFGKNTTAFSNIDLLLVPDNFGTSGVYYTGAAASNSLGFAVMPAGDFNGDGIADFLMSASGASPVVNSASRSSAGIAYLVHGAKTGLVTTDMSTFTTGAKGVRFLGAKASDGLGRSLGGVGDVNDDGIDDIAIGAYMATTPTTPTRFAAGIVYVMFGTTVAFTADFDLKDFNAFNKGFAIYGYKANFQLLTAAPLGDVNGDGVNDIHIGGLEYSRTHIIYGQKDARTAHVDTADPTLVQTMFTFTEPSYMGVALDGGKDFNGDGIPDILMGGYRSVVTPESGGAPIDDSGAVWMLPGPFIVPTDPPSSPPSITPSMDPSALPSAMPSADPSVVSTVHPTAVDPTMAPTMLPSADPSENPSLMPSANPTIDPSLEPSVRPSFEPTFYPSVAPSWMPSVDPSVDPSRMPTLNPSANPTIDPSVEPSVKPSTVPSNNPTFMPSASPSESPTLAPTAAPSFRPTAAPSADPTARPTLIADKDFTLTVNVAQDVFALDKSKYDAQQAAYNLTIQHTVADAADSVIPERVTDIVVEEEEEGGRGRSYFRNVVVASASNDAPVRLMYKITVHDPLYTVEKLRAELVQAAQEGRMDASFRHFAMQFGATGLNNATFALPQVTSASEAQSDSSAPLNAWQIALVVIGGVLMLLLVGAGVRVWYKRSSVKQIKVLPVAQSDAEE